MPFKDEDYDNALRNLPAEHAQAVARHAQTLAEALGVMVGRTGSYGLAWRRYGALSNLLNAARKVERLMEAWWDGNGIPALHKDNLDDAIDALNYLAFFIQCAEDGNLTGERRVLPEEVEEEYFRVSGEAICEVCGLPWYKHPREKKYDAFDGQSMDLVRGCDGRLRKT